MQLYSTEEKDLGRCDAVEIPALEIWQVPLTERLVVGVVKIAAAFLRSTPRLAELCGNNDSFRNQLFASAEVLSSTAPTETPQLSRLASRVFATSSSHSTRIPQTCRHHGSTRDNYSTSHQRLRRRYVSPDTSRYLRAQHPQTWPSVPVSLAHKIDVPLM